MQWLLTYFKESWQELGKVSWPNREETIKWTIAVIIFSLIFAAYTAAVDYVFVDIVERVLLRR